ncbi:phospholipase D family protein [uncultured Gordonia sp.]|nr:phospholipase D family protein [uncultured Gordonia sp.]RUP40398.1 MAG: hypothetical protein EKK60_03940 [Gordonia sp. (in: high G+C Gram-positive bacteria)]HNP57056.1 phospholipase D family protein [Gordonia sp. (in: high G+C Gram-positive bacteria)]
MLPPDSRTTLLKQIAPAPGSTIEHLVGTTFTLDLESALLPCLALVGSSNTGSADVVETVAAIKASIGNVDIFHQAGQISVPRDRGPLFSLLEPSVHGIHRAQGLFHPKLWLGVYRDEDGEETVRLLILSRNLTKDRSWDVALSLDGRIGRTRNQANAPLEHLLTYLGSASVTPIAEHRQRRLAELGKRLQKVEWELPDGVVDLAFHVYGLPRRTLPTPDFSGYEHLIVSPFLSVAGIKHVAGGKKGHLTVVSRQDALNNLNAQAQLVDTAYVLSPNAGIPAEDDEKSSGGTILNDLHAKIYAVERNRRSHVFIGSANATGNAFSANVEILAELTAQTKTWGVQALLGNSGFGSILQKTEIAPGTAEDDEEQKELDQFVRSVAGVPLTATPTLTDGVATMVVASKLELPTVAAGVSLSLSPLTVPAKNAALTPGSTISVAFDGLKLVDVTAFFVIDAEDAGGRHSKSVIKAELVGDIPGRLDSIVTDQIDSAEAFMRLLALILGFGVPPEEGEEGVTESQGVPGASWNQAGQGLFELIMRASVANEEGLRHLAGVVSSITKGGDPNHVLPEGFADLWSAVVEATGVEGGQA